MRHSSSFDPVLTALVVGLLPSIGLLSARTDSHQFDETGPIAAEAGCRFEFTASIGSQRTGTPTAGPHLRKLLFFECISIFDININKQVTKSTFLFLQIAIYHNLKNIFPPILIKISIVHSKMILIYTGTMVRFFFFSQVAATSYWISWLNHGKIYCQTQTSQVSMRLVLCQLQRCFHCMYI